MQLSFGQLTINSYGKRIYGEDFIFNAKDSIINNKTNSIWDANIQESTEEKTA